LVIEPGPGLTRRELASRAAYLERAAIGEARRAARAFMLSLARRAAVELARLVHWRSADVEAIEALPAPVAVGRGPPSRGSAMKDPWRVRTGIGPTIATRKGAPNMTDTREKAPKRFPTRDSLKILHPDHQRSTTPAQAYLIAHPLCAAGSAAGPNKVACRALAIG
jgi:hypothetical protein